MEPNCVYFYIYRVGLRVAALGNLLIFALVQGGVSTGLIAKSDDQSLNSQPPGVGLELSGNGSGISDVAVKWYLTALFLETEVIFLFELWNQMITTRRQQPELRQWQATTLVLRDCNSPLVYYIHILNILLGIVWLCSWNYITYFCGIGYSILILLGI